MIDVPGSSDDDMLHRHIAIVTYGASQQQGSVSVLYCHDPFEELGHEQGRRIISKDYAVLLAEVKERVRAAQYEALRAVNKELVGLYWDIGRMIVERQAGKSWGKAVVERLAADLQAEFPGVDGFSASNLWRMKSFFETYTASENSHHLCEKSVGATISSLWADSSPLSAVKTQENFEELRG